LGFRWLPKFEKVRFHLSKPQLKTIQSERNLTMSQTKRSQKNQRRKTKKNVKPLARRGDPTSKFSIEH